MVKSVQSNHNKNATKGDLVADAGEERLLAKHRHSCEGFGHDKLQRALQMATLFRMEYSKTLEGHESQLTFPLEARMTD